MQNRSETDVIEEETPLSHFLNNPLHTSVRTRERTPNVLLAINNIKLSKLNSYQLCQKVQLTPAGFKSSKLSKFEPRAAILMGQ